MTKLDRLIAVVEQLRDIDARKLAVAERHLELEEEREKRRRKPRVKRALPTPTAEDIARARKYAERPLRRTG